MKLIKTIFLIFSTAIITLITVMISAFYFLKCSKWNWLDWIFMSIKKIYAEFFWIFITILIFGLIIAATTMIKEISKTIKYEN